MVHAVLTPRQLMEFAAIAYTMKGKAIHAELKGRAACYEFTAKPYITKEAYVSALCSGARTIYSNFRDNELVLGAPSDLFTEVVEGIEKISNSRGTLCGCRIGELPPGLLNCVGNLGFTKFSDYIAGVIEGLNLRLFFDKNASGKVGFLTVHAPVKFQSEEEANKAKKLLRYSFENSYTIGQRGPWLDIKATFSIEAVGVDPLNGLGLYEAIIENAKKIGEKLHILGLETQR
jgi:hypothetical protein